MENNNPINFYDSLPQELIPEILSGCDDPTFEKIYSLTAKKVSNDVKVATTAQLDKVFKLPFLAWKKLDINKVKAAISRLEKEIVITELLAQTNEWIATLEGSKKFYQWIKIFGDECIKSYETEGSKFKTSEHQALYYLLTPHIQNITDHLYDLVNQDKVLEQNYPFVVNSLTKSYLIIEFFKAKDYSDAARDLLFKKLKQLQQQRKPTFINLLGENCIRMFVAMNTHRQGDEKIILTGANLSSSNLGGQVLTAAILREANLSAAELSSACFFNADMFEVNLSGATMYATSLGESKMNGADLSGANLTAAKLYDADLSNANLSGANLSRADLSGANLSGADLRGANLSGVEMSKANLSGATLDDIKIDDCTNFNGANLTGVNFSPEKLQSIKQTSWLCIERWIRRLGTNVTQLDKFYQESICEGNLWDIQRDPKLNNSLGFFSSIVSNRKLMTTHRIKVNTTIIDQATKLMATASVEEKNELEALIKKISDFGLEHNQTFVVEETSSTTSISRP